MIFLKETLPFIICLGAGLISFASYYASGEGAEFLLGRLNLAFIIISSFAFVVGLCGMISSHAKKIRRQADGWGYSAFLLLGVFIGVACGLASGGRQFASGGLSSFGWVYNYMLTPLQSAMFALLAFYIVSAAARTFRVRSAQTAVLSLAALVVLIARVPPGQQLADAAGLGSVKNFVEWLLTVPAVAVRRALMCGIALGIIVTSVKIIFGIERGYAGRRR